MHRLSSLIRSTPPRKKAKFIYHIGLVGNRLIQTQYTDCPPIVNEKLLKTLLNKTGRPRIAKRQGHLTHWATVMANGPGTKKAPGRASSPFLREHPPIPQLAPQVEAKDAIFLASPPDRHGKRQPPVLSADQAFSRHSVCFSLLDRCLFDRYGPFRFLSP